eukprot:Awhi_evm1s13345
MVYKLQRPLNDHIDFQDFYFELKTYLEAKGLFEYVLELQPMIELGASEIENPQNVQSIETEGSNAGNEDGETAAIANLKQKLGKVKLVIISNVAEKYKHCIRQENCVAKQILNLKEATNVKTGANLAAQTKKFHNMRMKEEETLLSFRDRMEQSVKCLEEQGNKPSEVSIAQVFMAGLPKKYKLIVNNFESKQARKNRVYKIEEIFQSALNWETVMDNDESEDDVKGYQAGGSKSEKYCSNCKTHTHDTKDCWSKNGNGNKNKGNTKRFNVKCYNCNGPHYKRDCPEKKENNNSDNEDGKVYHVKGFLIHKDSESESDSDFDDMPDLSLSSDSSSCDSDSDYEVHVNGFAIFNDSESESDSDSDGMPDLALSSESSSCDSDSDYEVTTKDFRMLGESDGVLSDSFYEDMPALASTSESSSSDSEFIPSSILSDTDVASTSESCDSEDVPELVMSSDSELDIVTLHGDKKSKDESEEGWLWEEQMFVMKEEKEIKSHGCHFMDSGASAHVTSDDSIFEGNKETNVNLKTVDGSKLPGLKQGKINGLDGKAILVKGIENTLISVSQLCNNGWTFTFNDNGFVGKKGARTMNGRLKNGMYVCAEENYVLQVNSDEMNDMMTWHRRLGHVGRAKLVESLGSEITASWPNKLDFCYACAHGQLKRTKVNRKPTENETEADVGEIFYMDLFGPMDVPSLAGDKYVLLAKDKKSRITACVPIKEKSDAFLAADALIKRVSKQGKTIKSIITDGGKEFDCENFNDMCKLHDIDHILIAPDTPELNGLAERGNGMVIHMMRTMMIDSGLAKKYWAECLNYCVYILNSLSTSALKDKISPEEVWSGKERDLNKIFPFGADVVYLYQTGTKKVKGKISSISRNGKLLGPDLDMHGEAWRILNTETKRIVSSRNFSVDVSDQPNCKKTASNKNNRNVKNSDDCDDSETDDIIQGYDSGIDSTDSDHSLSESSEDEESDLNPISNESDQESEDDNRDNEFPLITPEKHYKRNDQLVVKFDDEQSYKGKVVKVDKRKLNPYTVEFLNGKTIDVPHNRWARKIDDQDVNGMAVWTEPTSIAEMSKAQDSNEWYKAFSDEIDALKRNDTWKEVKKLPEGAKLIKWKPVFKIKKDENGVPVRRKVRLTVQGFTQRFGIDYHSSSSPVMTKPTFRVLLSIAAAKKLVIRTMDVDNAYLAGKLEEDLYVSPMEGMEVKKGSYLKLNKAIYGTKQGSRVFYNSILETMKKLNFKRTETDPCVFIRKSNGTLIIAAVYVDDYMTLCDSEKTALKFEKEIQESYSMKILGSPTHLIGHKVEFGEDFIFINQSAVVQGLVDELQMTNRKPLYNFSVE